MRGVVQRVLLRQQGARQHKSCYSTAQHRTGQAEQRTADRSPQHLHQLARDKGACWQGCIGQGQCVARAAWHRAKWDKRRRYGLTLQGGVRLAMRLLMASHRLLSSSGIPTNHNRAG